MSAHHPKASMIGATSVSTPMVRNPNERRVNIAAAGLAQIEAIPPPKAKRASRVTCNPAAIKLALEQLK